MEQDKRKNFQHIDCTYICLYLSFYLFQFSIKNRPLISVGKHLDTTWSLETYLNLVSNALKLISDSDYVRVYIVLSKFSDWYACRLYITKNAHTECYKFFKNWFVKFCGILECWKIILLIYDRANVLKIG